MTQARECHKTEAPMHESAHIEQGAQHMTTKTGDYLTNAVLEENLQRWCPGEDSNLHSVATTRT